MLCECQMQIIAYRNEDFVRFYMLYVVQRGEELCKRMFFYINYKERNKISI
jgi:hypothetical protein